MGILDEAIREHLELKRQHGADEPELKELEQDAFGPASRPGDPGDEPRSAEAEGERADDEPGPEEHEAAGPPEPEGKASDPGPLEAEVPVEPPSWERSEQSDDAKARATERRRREEVAHPATEEARVPIDVDSEEYEPPEPPTPPPDGSEEHALPVTGPSPMEAAVEAVEEPEPEVAEPEPVAEAPAPEPEPAPDPVDESLEVITDGESPLADFYDFEDESEGDLADELELALEDDEGDALPPPPLEPAPADEAPAPPPVDAPPPEDGPPEDAPPAPLPPAGEPPPPAEEPPVDDVLEETPEFLRDAPESDELWFEQRPPKDFDFDD